MVELKEGEKNIVGIVSEMIKEGQSEESIVKTLRSIGIKEDEARRLILVAQAQSFDLLKGEIAKIVDQSISPQKTSLKDLITQRISQAALEKITLPKLQPQAPQKPIEKKKGFFSGLFKKKEKILEAPKAEEISAVPLSEVSLQAAEPSAAQLQPSEGKAVVEIASEEILAAQKKLSELEAEHAKYMDRLDSIEAKARMKKLLSEMEIVDKIVSKKKSKSIAREIGKIKSIVSPEKQAELEKTPEQKSSETQLRTMKDLAEAAKAITLAAEKVVQAAPKPKIVITGTEEVLSLDQEIEQLKKTMKRLEVDFYKRRISLQDFQSHMLDYQTRLYELEEKKRILQKSKVIGKNYSGKVSPKLEKSIEQKLQGRMSEDRLMEIEKYISELLRRNDIPEKQFENSIKTLDAEALLASIESLAKTAELEKQARAALEQSKAIASQPQQPISQPMPEPELQETTSEQESRQEILQELQKIKESISSEKTAREARAVEKRPFLTPVKEQSEKNILKIIADMARSGEAESRITKTLRDLGLSEEEAIKLLLKAQREGTKIREEVVEEELPVRKVVKKLEREVPEFEQPEETFEEIPVKKTIKKIPVETIEEKEVPAKKGPEKSEFDEFEGFDKFEEEEFPPKKPVRKDQFEEIEEAPAKVIRKQARTFSREAPEETVVKEYPKVIVDAPEILEAKRSYIEPQRVEIKPVGEIKYVRAPKQEMKRVLVEPERNFSEAEIPSYPETGETRQKEKQKTIEKEIQKYRIITDLDKILQFTKEKGFVGINDLVTLLGIDKKKLQELVEILEENDLVRIEYPAIGDARIVDKDYTKPVVEKKQPKQKEEKKKEIPQKQSLPKEKKPLFSLGKKKETPKKEAPKKEALKKEKKPLFSFGKKK